MQKKTISKALWVSSCLCACVHTAAVADVQVLLIRDASLTSSSPSSLDPSGVSGPSVVDGLCVVNTEPGKGVRLTFSSAHGIGSDGISWQMKDVSTGVVVLYRQSASLQDGTGEVAISGAPGGAFIDVPASRVAISAATCPPGGNVRKRIVLFSSQSTNGQWTDTLSVSATSL